MNIQRYETVGYASDTVKHDTGKYVKWEDVEKLLALRTAEAAELEAWRRIDALRNTPRENWNQFAEMELQDYMGAAVERLENARNTTNAARRAAGVEQ